MALRSCLSLVILYHVVQCSSHRGLGGKYRPFGPMRFLQMCEDSTNFSKSIKKYRCQRVNNSQDPTEEAFICLDERMVNIVTTASSILTRKPKECKPFVKGVKVFSKRNKVNLLDACYAGRLDDVRDIVSRELEDINCRGKNGITPVMAAARYGQWAIFEYLVSQGCDLLASDDDSQTVLHTACEGGNFGIVFKLVDDINIELESKDKFENTPVMLASMNCNVKVVQLLHSRGCNMTAVNKDNNNILHHACSEDCINVVRYILSKRLISIESKGEKGETPVLAAVRQCSTATHQVLQFLAAKGCNLTEVVINKDNIFHYASYEGCINVVRYILSKKILSIESRGRYGQTPVLAAASYCELRLIKLLAAKGCNLTEIDNLNNNILHYASYGGCIHVVRYILSKRMISIESRGEGGRTPVMAAASFWEFRVAKLRAGKGRNLTEVNRLYTDQRYYARCSDWENYAASSWNDEHTPVGCICKQALVMVLASKGCNLTEVDSQKNNILHVAIMSGCYNIVKYIVSQDIIDTDNKNGNGQTPLEIAEESVDRDMVELLTRKMGGN